MKQAGGRGDVVLEIQLVDGDPLLIAPQQLHSMAIGHLIDQDRASAATDLTALIGLNQGHQRSIIEPGATGDGATDHPRTGLKTGDG